MTFPPFSPLPPLGPPRGTNFSRRKLTQPRPPSPAMTRILTSSINFISHQRAHHYVSPAKKKPRKGLSRFELRRALGRRDVNALAFLVESVVTNNSVDLGEQRKVPTHADVFSRVNASPQLPDNNVAGPNCFATEYLHPASLPLAVATVTGTSSGFLMCH